VQDKARRNMIGQNLAKARTLSGLSQSDVMSRIWLKDDPKQRNRISEIESGGTLPDAELLLQLCMLYGVSAGMMYNGMSEIAGDLLRGVVEQLARNGADYIAKMPKPATMGVLSTGKQVWNLYNQHKTKVPPELGHAIFEFAKELQGLDKGIAVSMRNYEMALQDCIERPDTIEKHQTLADLSQERMKRRPCTVLPKVLERPRLRAAPRLYRLVEAGQLSLFINPTGVCVQPQGGAVVDIDDDSEV
jgi:transcriptional regulator with XRE-family HTH domain